MPGGWLGLDWRLFFRPLFFFALFPVLFLAARVALVATYPQVFEDLSSYELVRGFLRGERFDLSIVLAVIGVPLALMTIPYAWARGRWWQGVFGWLVCGAFVIFAFALAVDLVYFDFVNHHIGPEIAIATQDLDEKAEIAFGQHRLALLAFVVFCAGSFWVWRRALRVTFGLPARPHRNMAASLALGGLVFLGARGQIGERLQIFHAFEGVPIAEAHLTLNAPFTAIHTLIKTGLAEVDFYPQEDAERVTRELLFSADERLIDRRFPLFRGRPKRKTEGPGPNVVVVLLEGWSALTVDAVREPLGLAPLHVTPSLDALSREGILFTRFYASGRRTLNGLCSLLTGFPCLPNLQYLGQGLEQMHMSYLGQMALSQGYSTYFLQGTNRTSHYQHRIAVIAGFQHFSGAEDIPGTAEKKHGFGALRSFDDDLLREANRQFAAAEKPFVGFVVTASTHAPYVYPRKDWKRYSGGGIEHDYRNSVEYADWALGRFFAAAKRSGYYDDTIFVVVSDHIQRGMPGKTPPSGFHIPCVVVAPGLEPRTENRVVSQTDLLPTIVDLAGWATPHAAVGRSLIDPALPVGHGALCRTSHVFLRVEPTGWVVHDLHNRLAAAADKEGADLDAIERRMLSVVQVATLSVLRNRLAPAEPAVAPKDPAARADRGEPAPK